MHHVMIIAEAGVNHNGEIKKALELVEVAAAAKVDFVKFQTFKAESLAGQRAQKATYQKVSGPREESQQEMLKKLELPFEDFKKIKTYAQEKGIGFLSTGFDFASLDFLYELGLPLFKIPSGELNNYPYLVKVAGFKKPIILSTGMATLQEVEDSVAVLLQHGAQRENLTVLHCTTEYPTPDENVNLLAMLSLRDRCKVSVGYSDHTLGIHVPIAAVALGARVIEKHFTLDRGLPGPDHKASLESHELIEMVQQIRAVETSLGEGKKQPTQGELANRIAARKSIVAFHAIKKGTPFTRENLTTQRPGDGMNPMQWPTLLGTLSSRDYQAGEPIQ